MEKPTFGFSRLEAAFSSKLPKDKAAQAPALVKLTPEAAANLPKACAARQISPNLYAVRASSAQVEDMARMPGVESIRVVASQPFEPSNAWLGVF